MFRFLIVGEVGVKEERELVINFSLNMDDETTADPEREEIPLGWRLVSKIGMFLSVGDFVIGHRWPEGSTDQNNWFVWIKNETCSPS